MTDAVNPQQPPRLYSWTVARGDDAGAVGVTDDYDIALDEVADSLHSAPAGARGLVHRVSPSFTRTGFVYEGLIARCRLDPDGGLVWDELPPPQSWGRLAPMFTDPPEPGQPPAVIGDGMPPEAVATGLADLKAHEERLARAASSSSKGRR